MTGSKVMSRLVTKNLGITIGATQVCTALDWHIESGQRWCILGRNGTGKTTLLHTLAGLRTADSGAIVLNRQPLQAIARRRVAQHIGLLFQEQHDAFPATVLETVLSGRHPWIGLLQWESVRDTEIAVAALQAVDLDGMEQRIVNSLSGGERRRLGLASLLAQDPAVMLLDEPTNHLDIHHQISMLELLRKRAETRHKALVFVMHDINLAARYCDHFLLLFGAGETAQGSADEVLTEAQLERLYRHPLQAVQAPHGTLWQPR